MSNGRIPATLAVITCLTASHALAQTTRTEEIEQDKAARSADVQPEAREKGDVIVTKLEHLLMPEPPAIRVSLGDFRPGAGLAAGVAYAAPVGKRALWTTTTAWSINNFKLAESRLELPELPGGRLSAATFVRWDDAPALAFFGLGNATSLGDEVSYGLQSVEVGGEVRARAARWFRYGASAGYLGARSSNGAGPSPIGSLFTDESAPGLGSTPTWRHTSAFAAIDWRASPGYTDSGGLYRIAFHDYADRERQFSFHRTEVDLRQFFPVLHHNWIIALQGRADLTDSATGQVIPYFMLPSIGGRDTLPGFQDYRFTDKDSLLLRSELRWTPSPLVDMAVFLDQGTVASSPGEFDLRDLKRGWGIGARLHGQTFTALRLEVAHSVEGWRYNIAQGVSF
jgi:hypothetical protein